MTEHFQREIKNPPISGKIPRRKFKFDIESPSETRSFDIGARRAFDNIMNKYSLSIRNYLKK